MVFVVPIVCWHHFRLLCSLIFLGFGCRLTVSFCKEAGLEIQDLVPCITHFLSLFKVIFYFPNGKSTIWVIYSEYFLFFGHPEIANLRFARINLVASSLLGRPEGDNLNIGHSQLLMIRKKKSPDPWS